MSPSSRLNAQQKGRCGEPETILIFAAITGMD